MLKSELVISEDLELLDSHLKHYTIRFLTPVFSDENGPTTGGYKKERTLMIQDAANNPQQARSSLIPQMFSERDLFVRVREIILRNKEWDIDPAIIQNTLSQMEAVRSAIEQCCVSHSLTAPLINNYYEESLVLLVYFSAIRSHILTIRNIRDKFQSDNIAYVLKFSHEKETSLSITQQKNIIIFVEKIFTCFFSDYLDIITVEVDTGSPKLDCPIRINLEAKVTWDITKLFSDFFEFIIGENTADAIRTLKKISDQMDKNQNNDIRRLKSIKNELTQGEYEKRLLDIYDSYNNLRKNQIAVAIDNTNITKKLEGRTPLLIEDSSAPLPEAT